MEGVSGDAYKSALLIRCKNHQLETALHQQTENVSAVCARAIRWGFHAVSTSFGSDTLTFHQGTTITRYSCAVLISALQGGTPAAPHCCASTPTTTVVMLGLSCSAVTPLRCAPLVLDSMLLPLHSCITCVHLVLFGVVIMSFLCM